MLQGLVALLASLYTNAEEASHALLGLLETTQLRSLLDSQYRRLSFATLLQTCRPRHLGNPSIASAQDGGWNPLVGSSRHRETHQSQCCAELRECCARSHNPFGKCTASFCFLRLSRNSRRVSHRSRLKPRWITDHRTARLRWLDSSRAHPCVHPHTPQKRLLVFSVLPRYEKRTQSHGLLGKWLDMMNCSMPESPTTWRDPSFRRSHLSSRPYVHDCCVRFHTSNPTHDTGPGGSTL